MPISPPMPPTPARTLTGALDTGTLAAGAGAVTAAGAPVAAGGADGTLAAAGAAGLAVGAGAQPRTSASASATSAQTTRPRWGVKWVLNAARLADDRHGDDLMGRDRRVLLTVPRLIVGLPFLGPRLRGPVWRHVDAMALGVLDVDLDRAAVAH